MTKACSVCKAEKNLDEFYKGSGRFKKSTWCKTCTRDYTREYEKTHYSPVRGAARLKRVYGLTPAGYYRLLENQGFCCASCGDELDLVTKHRTHIDHCHASGSVRGVLCRECNIALGHLRDDPQRITRLGAYLARVG